MAWWNDWDDWSDAVDLGLTWGDVGVSSSTEGTSAWASDLATAYSQASEWVEDTANARDWSESDLSTAWAYVDAAYVTAASVWVDVSAIEKKQGDPAVFWDELRAIWPDVPSVPGWDELGATWGSADETAEDVREMAEGGDPDRTKTVKWAFIGVVAVSVLVAFKWSTR